MTRKPKALPLRHQLQLLQLPLRLAGSIESHAAAQASAPTNERTGPTTLAQPPKASVGFVSPPVVPSNDLVHSHRSEIGAAVCPKDGHVSNRVPLGEVSQGIQRHRLPFPTKGAR